MARRYAGWSGIAAAVLFGVGSGIWGLDMPEPGSAASEVVRFYEDTADRIVVGATLSLLGIAAFVAFAAGLRRVLAEAEGDDLLATTAFGGAVLGMAAGIGAETINMSAALRARDGDLSDALAQPLFEASQALGSTASAVGVGVFAVATAVAMLRTGAVAPRWAAVLTLLVGIVLLTPLGRVQELAGASMVLLGLVVGMPLLRRPDEFARPGRSTT